MSVDVGRALALTFLGAAGTALGGLLVVIQPKMDFKKLGALQGLAAGLMLSISLLDLLPEAAEEIGFVAANAFFYLGVVFFAAVVYFIPEPDATWLATGPPPSSGSRRRGSKPGPGSNGSSSGGAGGPAALAAKREVLLSGLVTAAGIALHNAPEGVAVFLASQKGAGVGLSLAVAIAAHNIPEGVAVALPVYFATGSRARGFGLAVLSGLAEPAAVLVLAAALPWGRLPKEWVDACLAGVGGIMAFLSFHELLPLAITHAGRHAAVASLMAGMALMSFNLYLVNHYIMPGGGH